MILGIFDPSASRELIGEWKRPLAKRNKLKSGYEHRRFGLITWEEIVAAIHREWGKPWEDLRRSRGHPAQAIGVWFARHRAGTTLEQVRQKLDSPSYHAAAMQVGRLQRQLPKKAHLRKQLNAIAKRLNVQS